MESPPPTPEDLKMEELGQVLATSCLPSQDNEASPSCLLSPIHLQGASLLSVDDKDNVVRAPLTTIKKEDENAPPAVENKEAEEAVVARDDEDVEEEDPEVREGVNEQEDKRVSNAQDMVAETPARAEEEEEMLREEPVWQMLPHFDSTAPWQAVSDEEDVAGLEPQQPIIARMNPS